MKRHIFHAHAVALLLLLPHAVWAEFDPAASNEELIAQLQEIDGAGIGFHPTAHPDGFVALDEVPKFSGGILGSAPPTVHSGLRELVRRGTEALPDLLAHVDDPRPTGFTVGDGFMGKWFGVEYDPRDPSKVPDGVHRPFVGSGGGGSLERTFETYTVKVGDVCYAAIGQIVNRQLNAVRYQPSLCLVVNSPVENPALAAATRADWKDLTPEDLAKSLEADVLGGNEVGGLQRLLFYFSGKGLPVAVRLLDRTPMDFEDERYFFRHTVLESKGDEDLDGSLRWFRRAHDATEWAGLILCLQRSASREDADPQSASAKQAKSARWALDRIALLQPSEEPVPVSDFGTLKRVVEAVAFFHSQEIDEAVIGLFEVAAPIECASPGTRFAQCQLVEACAERLLRTNVSEKQGIRDALAEFCARIRRENRREKSTGVTHVVERIERAAASD